MFSKGKGFLIVMLIAATAMAGEPESTIETEPVSTLLNEIDALYHSAGIDGVLLISSLEGDVEYSHNADKVTSAKIPASTFKIPNTLIALEEEVIKDQFEIIKWDGVNRTYAPWNSDQTLATAFARSCVWCYQHFAAKIGNGKYQHYLDEFDYGNKITGKDVTTFWLEGDLRISPRQQIVFLRKVYVEDLPIKSRNFKILKEIMLAEETPDYKIWAKTGWQDEHGWYVGYVETHDDVWFFANYIKVREKADLVFRKQLTLEALKLKGIIHPDKP